MRFADTSYWQALLESTDRHHRLAVAVTDVDEPVVTSNLVLGETWTLVRRRRDHRSALQAVTTIRRTRGIEVRAVTTDDEVMAWRWLERHDEREYSFVDATSFAMMRRLRISYALAFDDDFTAAGFVELRP